MSGPYVEVGGVLLIADKYGNIVDTIEVESGKRRMMADATMRGGNSPYYAVDVELVAGVRRLKTDATVTVEQVFGFDDFADTWGALLSGPLDGTIRTQIAGWSDPTGTERDQPAVDVTTTVEAAEVNDDIALRDKHILALNNDANFSSAWKAYTIKDNPIVYIGSKFVGEYGERPLANDYQFTAAGGCDAQPAFDHIKRRGKQNSGAKDPKDRRYVTVGVSGEVQSLPSAVGDLVIGEHPTNPTYAESMAVNGSVTPVVYRYEADAEKDVFIEALRFYGQDNGVKYGQFLGNNQALVNGIKVEIKADNILRQFHLIKTTEDFKDFYGWGADWWVNDVGAGADDFAATLNFSTTFPLRKQGTHGPGNDDFVRITVQDNLSSVLKLESVLKGFKKEV